jgi:hypothetical protein
MALSLPNLLLALALTNQLLRNERLKRKRDRQRHPRQRDRRWYVRPGNEYRSTRGAWVVHLHELAEKDPELFRKYTRMTPVVYEKLYKLCKLDLKLLCAHPTHAMPIKARERLLITIRFLATGDSRQTLGMMHLISDKHIGTIINQVCPIIVKCLRKDYMRTPSTAAEWKQIALDYQARWNVRALGSVDGKHIRIVCPPNSGTDNYNYKHFFSKLLIGCCDSDYRFLFVSVGSSGSECDSGVFPRTSLGKALYDGTLPLPPDESLAGDDIPLPYCYLGDDAFALDRHMLKPYPGRYLPESKLVYNYRISRGRRIIENTFGIMAARWRLLHRAICASEENADSMILAICSLHNFLCVEQRATYIRADDVDVGAQLGKWRTEVKEENFSALRPRQGGNRAAKSAADVRDAYARYFNGKGSVEWQRKIVTRGGGGVDVEENMDVDEENMEENMDVLVD